MDHSKTPSRVRQVAVPPAARARSELAHADYEDAFAVRVGPPRDRTAQQWLRAIIEGAPIAVRTKLVAGWSAIGLKLGASRSDRFVLGWEIRRDEPDHILLGAGSRIGMPAELLLERRRDDLLFATFVQLENRLARTVWGRVEPVHVPVVKEILEHAVRRLRLDT